MKIESNKLGAMIETWNAGDISELSDLLQCSNFITGQLYAYADALGDVVKQAKALHVLRRNTFARISREIQTSQNVSGAEAERQAAANAEYQEIYEKEYEAAGREEKGKLMFTAIKEVLQSMRQEIAEKRGERKMPDYAPQRGAIPANEPPY
jgi:hypothetical protein